MKATCFNAESAEERRGRLQSGLRAVAMKAICFNAEVAENAKEGFNPG